MSTIIHIDAAKPLHVLDEHGWTQGKYEDKTGEVCLHGAIRLCQPVPGDAMIIEQVAGLQGWGITWNDADDTTEQMVRDRLARGIDITDADLADTFGPQWVSVVALVRRCAVLTADEAERLATAAVRADAHAYAAAAAYTAAIDAYAYAYAAYAATAAYTAAIDASAAYAAAATAARTAVAAVAAYHLATQNGPYTIAHRDLLLAPWVTVIGPIEGLVTA